MIGTLTGEALLQEVNHQETVSNRFWFPAVVIIFREASG